MRAIGEMTETQKSYRFFPLSAKSSTRPVTAKVTETIGKASSKQMQRSYTGKHKKAYTMINSPSNASTINHWVSVDPNKHKPQYSKSKTLQGSTYRETRNAPTMSASQTGAVSGTFSPSNQRSIYSTFNDPDHGLSVQ